ncbi:GMC oxidoreductase [Novosphingobium gossypii]|uniref:GMC oxidoreductase n=1 Tax=Novosphingobium gossypii TaxID=1604774 RepID=UPI003D1C1ABC
MVVIGAGIGGGLAARRLTELGLNVLIIEKGKDFGDTRSNLPDGSASSPAARLEQGLWPEPLKGIVDGRELALEGVIGTGVGGTSLRYAATLERPEPHDLDDCPERPHPTQGWPVSYAEYAPYFDMAERYFCITGTPDPLARDKTPVSMKQRALASSEARFMRDLRSAGLNPYQTHMAALFLPDCESCFGRRCAKRCKMDGRTAGVLPAVQSGRAAVLDECTVLSINADDHVKSIKVCKDGKEFVLKARAYLLSAGGLGSPSLLLRSKNEVWPTGLGNRYGLVGRNLMFHLSEILAVWPKGRTGRARQAERSVSFRDLYHRDDLRLGLVQSMGLTARYGEIMYAAQIRLASSAFRNVPFARSVLRLPVYLASSIMGAAHLFVGILEDLPSLENRVLMRSVNSDSLDFQYSIGEELHDRRRHFRQAMYKAFPGHSRMFMSHQPQLNYAHPCGTVRFGIDPRTSVLDPSCRVRGIDNLFVVDSSFMPTSNGVNPSLMIGANALRVAEAVASSVRGYSAPRYRNHGL